MRIEDYDTVWNVTKPTDIEAALFIRHGAGRNAFWLSPGSEEFPSINIMVSGDLAYILYFPKKRHPGFASIGTVPSLRSGGETSFFPDDTDETFEIMNQAVVRFADALKVAQEFAISPALPKSIQWSEL
jgi:hypothetical protein